MGGTWDRDHPHPCSHGLSPAGGLAQAEDLGVLVPTGSSFETQDQHNHPQLKVPAPFPPQIRFPPRFCLAGTELLIGFVLLVFQLPQIWAGSARPAPGGTEAPPGLVRASRHLCTANPRSSPGVALEGAGQPPHTKITPRPDYGYFQSPGPVQIWLQ